MQGVICFESLMEEGRRRGIVKENKPIVCKPNKVVSSATDTISVSCPASFRQALQGYCVA